MNELIYNQIASCPAMMASNFLKKNNYHPLAELMNSFFMKFLKKFHLIFGFSIFVLFILTGQYMHHKFNHLIDMPLTERALFRAGHIYILFLSMINISLGSYFSIGKTRFVRVCQLLGSFFIVISTILIIYSFF